MGNAKCVSFPAEAGTHSHAGSSATSYLESGNGTALKTATEGHPVAEMTMPWSRPGSSAPRQVYRAVPTATVSRAERTKETGAR